MGYAQEYAAGSIHEDDAVRRYRAYEGIDRIKDDEERGQTYQLHRLLARIQDLKQDALVLGCCLGLTLGIFGLMGAVYLVSKFSSREFIDTTLLDITVLSFLPAAVAGMPVCWWLLRLCYFNERIERVGDSLRLAFLDPAAPRRLQLLKQLDPKAVASARRFLPEAP